METTMLYRGYVGIMEWKQNGNYDLFLRDRG